MYIFEDRKAKLYSFNFPPEHNNNVMLVFMKTNCRVVTMEM
jgi:hypothetical protein